MKERYRGVAGSRLAGGCCSNSSHDEDASSARVVAFYNKSCFS